MMAPAVALRSALSLSSSREGGRLEVRQENMSRFRSGQIYSRLLQIADVTR